MAEQKQPENPIAKRFKAATNEWLFNYQVELIKPTIIKNFREWLKPLSPAKIKEMVRTGEMPKLDPAWFDAISGYRKYLLKIKVDRMAEFIALAREDLMRAIMECGEEGHIWQLKLHVHLLECVDNPEKLLPEVPKTEAAPEEVMVMARCESCNKTWPVKKEEFSRIEKCPFCAAPQGTPVLPTEKPEEIPAQEEPEETQV